jgi:putative ABC transport system permease protein
MRNTLKIALKVLGRRKFFTFISLFGISLTLVVLMVATAMLDNIFAPRAPESRFDRVLYVVKVVEKGSNATMMEEPGYGFVQQFVKTLPGIERAGTFSNPQETAIYKNGTRMDTTIKRTDGDYWKILDFRFVEGRPFTSQEDERGDAVAVITESMRDKLFGSGSALGKTFIVDGQTFRVIGVVPNVSITRIAAYADIWMPIGTLRSSEYRHEMLGGFNGIVLARSSSDFPRLKREFQASLINFPIDRKMFNEVRVGLDTLFEAIARQGTGDRAGEGSRAALILSLILFTLAILFMTLPALNLVTLNLSRILERASEIGVRKAFGASRPALVRQFVTENVILTLIGGLIGFALTVVILPILSASQVVPAAQFDVNFRIFAYAMLIAIFFGLFSGVYPAWRMSRLDPVDALRGGAK